MRWDRTLADRFILGYGDPLFRHRSADGARKLVLRASDRALIETVLLPATSAAARYDADAAAAEDGPETAAPGEDQLKRWVYRRGRGRGVPRWARRGR